MGESTPTENLLNTTEEAILTEGKVVATRVQYPFHMKTLQEEMLHCSICQFRIEDPKDLDCQHSFCKCCLDELLVFGEDGSAQIQCPMRCPAMTFISAEQTTNDLKTSYTLKSILEWFQQQESERKGNGIKQPKCDDQSNCNKEVSKYCLSCSKVLCNKCSNNLCAAPPPHATGTDNCNQNHPGLHKCVLVRYNNRANAVEAVCESHDTWARYLCCENELICVYCKHRTHYDHTEQHQCIADICKRIHNDINTQQQYDAQSQDVKVANALAHLKNEVVKTLQRQCLQKFRTFMMSMKADENNCMQELDEFEQYHMTKYSKIATAATHEEHQPKQYLLPDFQLALERSLASSINIPGDTSYCSDDGGREFESSKDLIFTSNVLPNSSFHLNIKLAADGIVTSVNDPVSSTGTSSPHGDLEPGNHDNSEVLRLSQELGDIYTRVCEILEDEGKASNDRSYSTEDVDSKTSSIIQDAAAHPSAPSLAPSDMRMRVLSIKRGKKGFGFTIDSCDRGWEVKYVRDDKRCVGLLPGDIITSINGINVRHKEFEEIVEILKRCSLQKNTDFTVER